MMTPETNRSLRRVLSIICMLSCFVASAQLGTRSARAKGKVKIKNVYFSYLISPPFTTSSRPKIDQKKDWLQIQIMYETEGGKAGWFDELTFEWHLLMFPAGKAKAKPYLMHRTVSYGDVATGRHVAVMYMRPRFMLRHGGTKRVSKRDIALRIEARIDGIKAGFFEVGGRIKKVPKSWWQIEPPRIIIKSNELLMRTETPFVNHDADSYEYIKAKKGN